RLLRQAREGNRERRPLGREIELDLVVVVATGSARAGASAGRRRGGRLEDLQVDAERQRGCALRRERPEDEPLILARIVGLPRRRGVVQIEPEPGAEVEEAPAERVLRILAAAEPPVGDDGGRALRTLGRRLDAAVRPVVV